ncbi:unnamed protein product [Pieris macdunnoughi]|uniref:Uncharacterized protein n=1 Tax=Pieris macdunnoughi TaxID=345717 RepID=A0A821SK46_9NEOP|nr:unnamed protein product [Pieris macdunnoughi]
MIGICKIVDIYFKISRIVFSGDRGPFVSKGPWPAAQNPLSRTAPERKTAQAPFAHKYHEYSSGVAVARARELLNISSFLVNPCCLARPQIYLIACLGLWLTGNSHNRGSNKIKLFSVNDAKELNGRRSMKRV